jgi:hypothetical protein
MRPTSMLALLLFLPTSHIGSDQAGGDWTMLAWRTSPSHAGSTMRASTPTTR